MSIAGTVDAPLELFGGIVTDMAAADLPPGVSPDCRDVAFLQGGVKTRPGLVSVFAPIAGNPTVNYLKTFTTPNLVKTLLAMDSAGTLWGENSPGVLTQIATGLTANAAANSTSLFGREYISQHDGNFGVDIPRQFDGMYLDRVSQVGPAAGPIAVADVVAYISAISRTSNVVTVATATATGLIATDQVTIAGVTDASYDGVFPILSIIDSLHFTYSQTNANSSSSGGSAAPVGSISAGVHQCSVIFVTRQGYLTRPSPPISWTAVGGRRANVTGLPWVGTLPNVVARILAFTGAGGDLFYYTTGLSGAPQMQIFDNTLTSFVVDFSDTALLAGIEADYLFNLVELGECAGVIGYSDRLFWWGERNKQNNWDNLTFDGGFGGVGNNVPLGWTPDPTFFAGGTFDSSGEAVWGTDYLILGDGATATRGLITQSAVTDYNGAPRLQTNTNYSARVRVRMTGALTQGTLHVHLYSALGGISTPGISVPAAQITTGAWKEFIAPITPALGFLTIPADLVLRVYADGTPTLNAGFMVENIEIFPTAQPYNTSLVRASYADDPESYDGVTGFMNVSENDGQTVRAAFLVRERLYLVKDRSMHVTQDDGVNEPASWTINEVSNSVGTPSVSGVAVGEDWAVIAGRAGMYLFDGGEPLKISQEIQPLWDTINWAAGQTLWVSVDARNKRILCGVPTGTATSPNLILMMDYRSLSSGGEIGALGSILFSTLSGKLYAVGRSRKWSPWYITANACTLAERSDGTAQLFLGNGLVSGAGNGKIYQLSDTQFSDDGAAINSYYTTYFFLSHDLEQTYQVRSHRKLFAYLTMYAEGAGNLNLSAFVDNEAFPAALATLPLSSPGSKDLEMPINLLGERVAFQLGTNTAGAWFKLERFIPSLLPDPWAPVRGGN
ncbi:MAG TPA: hypothetical protein VK709_16155 [Candidatus Saccharimonadales bacterium]|nr:hypothetical protein [Candidatus Saccharimonadales bacterium]